MVCSGLYVRLLFVVRPCSNFTQNTYFKNPEFCNSTFRIRKCNFAGREVVTIYDTRSSYTPNWPCPCIFTEQGRRTSSLPGQCVAKRTGAIQCFLLYGNTYNECFEIYNSQLKKKKSCFSVYLMFLCTILINVWFY